MSKIDETAVWECYDGESNWVACYKCAYEWLTKDLGITDGVVLGKNYKTESGNISISEDFFNEHGECEHTCESCDKKLN
jgi:hypothetical protein